MEDIHSALIAAVEENGWSANRLADAANITEAGAKKWLAGSVPGGASLLLLIKHLPGFGRRLGLAGKAVAR